MDEITQLEEKLANLIFLKKKMAEELAGWQDKQSLDVMADQTAFQDAEDKMEDIEKDIEETRLALQAAKETVK